MGRPCARQSNIPRPPFPRRNRRDEVHAARSAQTICAFRRGGCHPPAGRTLCAPTLRVLFLGRVELQGEVRDMGPGRRCHAAARSRAGSLSLRLGLVSGPPRGPVLALAPLQAPLLTACALRCHAAARSRAGSLSLRLGLVSGPPRGPALALASLQAPLLTACALLIVTLRIGRMAGSITPTTPPKPTRAWGAPWAFGIRSVVISPVRLWVALKWSHAPIGRIAGSTTPPTPGRPGSASGRPWALPIRSGVCLPYAPMGRA